MAEVSSGVRVLTAKDAVKVLEELLPAQNQSYELGLTLNLPPHEVKSVHTTFTDPRKRLLQIVIEFLNQVDPQPTWRVIVDALNNPVVNLPQLARAVETAHFPETRPTPVSEATVSSSQSPVLTSISPLPVLPPPSSATGGSLTDLQRRPELPQPSPMTSQYVQAKIRRFEKRFNELKKAARECLVKRKISVEQVVDSLTSMPADDLEEHKQFLKENLSDLRISSDIPDLIGKLSLLYWDYLSYQLLEYLIKEFGLEVEREMEVYKLDLQKFRQKTPLALFFQSQKRRRRKPSEEFQEMVAEFDWPHEVTLEVVEQFRQEFAYHYKLRDCAMMLAVVCPGSFIVTWFIPESIVKKLREDIPNCIIKKYAVVNLDIAGGRVYPLPQCNMPDGVKGNFKNTMCVDPTAQPTPLQHMADPALKNAYDHEEYFDINCKQFSEELQGDETVAVDGTELGSLEKTHLDPPTGYTLIAGQFRRRSMSASYIRFTSDAGPEGTSNSAPMMSESKNRGAIDGRVGERQSGGVFGRLKRASSEIYLDRGPDINTPEEKKERVLAAAAAKAALRINNSSSLSMGTWSPPMQRSQTHSASIGQSDCSNCGSYATNYRTRRKGGYVQETLV